MTKEEFEKMLKEALKEHLGVSYNWDRGSDCHEICLYWDDELISSEWVD